jgi:hypothetical protein
MTMLRVVLTCVLALAVFAFRTPIVDLSAMGEVAVSGHDHHGHSHDDDDTTSSAHDRSHVGDHSHEIPNTVPHEGFRIAMVTEPKLRLPDIRAASLTMLPGERPPRIA